MARDWRISALRPDTDGGGGEEGIRCAVSSNASRNARVTLARCAMRYDDNAWYYIASGETVVEQIKERLANFRM